MLKLKVLLTKMAEMLKNLSDNKVDMTSPIYNYDTNASSDDDDYNLNTAINNLAWINNVATDSNHNKISVKKMFTEILNQIKTNTDFIKSLQTDTFAPTSSLPVHPGNQYWVTSTNSYKTGCTGYCRFQKVGKIVYCTFSLTARGGTGSPSGVIIKDSQVFNIPTGFRPKAGSDGSVRKEYFSAIVISKTGVPLGTWAYATSSGKISYDRSSDAEVIMGSGFWLTS